MRPLTLFLPITALLLAVGPPAAAQCSALSFDGADDWVRVPNDASFPEDVWTGSIWVRPDGVDDVQVVVGIGEGDTNDALTFWIGLNAALGEMRVRVEANNNVGQTYVAPGLVLDDGAWHHLAATRDDAGTLVMYYDGAAVNTVPNSVNPATPSQDLSIGATRGIGGGAIDPQPPARFFAGDIDQVAVWKRTLSAAEVADVRSLGVDLGDVDLVGAWNLEEAAGQSVTDVSGHGNDGTLGIDASVAADDPTWIADNAPLPPPMPFEDVGLGLAGSTGVPTLVGDGSLCPETPVTLSIAGAVPSGSAILVLGISRIDAPLKQGTLVPSPDFLLPSLPIDGNGVLEIPFEWPAGLPSDFTSWFQVWIPDAGAPKGFAATNGLGATTP